MEEVEYCNLLVESSPTLKVTCIPMKLTSSNGYEYQVDEEDAHLTRAKSWCVHNVKNGQYRYVVNVVSRGGKSTMVYLHRLITGAKKGELVDHIDGNTLDNRKSNLRIVDQRLNQGNRRVICGKVPFKGVTFERGKYRARIKSCGKKLHLGFFNTAIEASIAYRDAALKVFGECAYSNAPLNYTPTP